MALWAWDPSYALPTHAEAIAIVNAKLSARELSPVTAGSVLDALEATALSRRGPLMLTNIPGAPRRDPVRPARPVARRTINVLAGILRDASLPTNTAYAAALLTHSFPLDALAALHLKPRPYATWFGLIRHTVTLATEDKEI